MLIYNVDWEIHFRVSVFVIFWWVVLFFALITCWKMQEVSLILQSLYRIKKDQTVDQYSLSEDTMMGYRLRKNSRRQKYNKEYHRKFS